MLDTPAPSMQERIAAVANSLLARDGSQAVTSPDEELGALGLTSLNMVNLMLAIEAEFAIEIPRRDLLPDNFRTLSAIERLVARLTAS